MIKPSVATVLGSTWLAFASGSQGLQVAADRSMLRTKSTALTAKERDNNLLIGITVSHSANPLHREGKQI